MTTNLAQDPSIRRGAIRWLVREAMGNLTLIAIVFLIAGRLDWPMGWALSGIYIVWSAATTIFILPVNPAMLAERARPHADRRTWDMALLQVSGLLIVATYAVAGLNLRWDWSPQLPLVLQIVSLVVAVLGFDILLVWAMVSNAFFVATVRIQTEPHHTVTSIGPYRYIRHPGYAGTILFYLVTPFMLSSLWSVIPAVTSISLLVVRTALEDKTLRAELPGYEEYAARVRYRLVPGVW